MTQKQALTRVLERIPSSFGADSDTQAAERAFFVVEWLHDMNWHPEADALEERALAAPRLHAAFRALERDDQRTGTIEDHASFLNGIFGWGLETDDWRATQGAPLVEELWGIIIALPD
jgi:hypothetical protein